MPFPRDETTPPVTNTYFALMRAPPSSSASLFRPGEILGCRRRSSPPPPRPPRSSIPPRATRSCSSDSGFSSERRQGATSRPVPPPGKHRAPGACDTRRPAARVRDRRPREVERAAVAGHATLTALGSGAASRQAAGPPRWRSPVRRREERSTARSMLRGPSAARPPGR